jgi:hypothetical protein
MGSNTHLARHAVAWENALRLYGHGDIRLTRFYAHLSWEHFGAAVGIWDRSFEVETRRD